MNAELKKFGEEFWSKSITIPRKDGTLATWHDVGTCITPKETEEATLENAWQNVREIAKWIESQSPKIADHFRIIVGWSKKIREHKGQIFKIWEPNEELPKICAAESYSDYCRQGGKDYILLKGWQKDVFQKQNHG